MLRTLRRWLGMETREERILRTCGCVCRCPACDDILNDQSMYRDNGDGHTVTYGCGCGATSLWLFSTPVPVLLGEEAGMPIKVIFECGGCGAKAEGTDRLRREFRSISGRSWGFGRVVPANTVDDVVPDGWVAYDPWTYCTYCPACYAEVVGDTDQETTDSEDA